MSNSVHSIRILPTEQYFALVRQQLSDNGQAFVRVTGDSMRPLLHHLRDGVILVSPGQIRKGDIVLFDRRNGHYALHRVIRAGKNGFAMAGDNQWHVEQDLAYSQVVGVAAAIQRNGRRIACDTFSQRVFAWALASLAFPRMKVRKALGKLIKPFRRSGGKPEKGAST